MLPPFLNQDTESTALPGLYGEDRSELSHQRSRYISIVDQFHRYFGVTPTHLFSSPGRCELGGNHTDHNGGCVLAAAINLDVVAAVRACDESSFTVYSSGYEAPFHVDLHSLVPNHSEHPSCQLLRGIAAGFDARGHRIGGLQVFLHSDVLFASGLSSSAALEILFATVLNDLFNHSSIDLRELAEIGQRAEHIYWRKPVGLLDQLTIGTGGIVHMRFEHIANPIIDPLDVDFASYGLELLLVNPGGHHANLTAEYRQIPAEMESVASFFGQRRLIEIDEADIIRRLPELRRSVGDRAVLRALHFFEENKRVQGQVRALREGEIGEFLNLVRASGSSSWRFLQNVCDPSQALSQPLGVALALSELQTNQLSLAAAYRVHGGGFGGTILLIVPAAFTRLYQLEMEEAFGEGVCHRLRVRPFGCVDVNTVEVDGMTTGK
jgi:galactokinase